MLLAHQGRRRQAGTRKLCLLRAPAVPTASTHPPGAHLQVCGAERERGQLSVGVAHACIVMQRLCRGGQGKSSQPDQ